MSKTPRLADVFTDEDGHRIHAALWGGVAEKHNTNPDGSPFGDCYKCRIIRDAVHNALRPFRPPHEDDLLP